MKIQKCTIWIKIQMRTHKTDMQNNFTKCQNVETHAFSHQTLMHLYAVADELKYIFVSDSKGQVISE